MTEKQALKQKLIQEYAKSGLVVQDSHLLLESRFENNKSRFEFATSNNQQGDIPSGPASFERKLDRNNLFYVTAMGVYLYQVALTAPKMTPQTFPSGAHFTGGTTFAAADLQRFYSSGKLFIKVDGRVYVDNTIRMLDFYHVPQTQKTGVADENQTPLHKGLLKPGVQIKLAGNKQNEIAINCPTYNGIQWEQDAADTEVRVGLYLKGFEVVGFQS